MAIIKESKTVQSAIDAALTELNCSEEDVEIEVLQEPTKGIFGLSKMAKVKVTPLNSDEYMSAHLSGEEPSVKREVKEVREITDLEKEGKRVLSKALTLMGFQTAKIKSRQDEEGIYLDVHSDSEGLLIGKHGQTVAALQYLVNRMIKDEKSKDARFIVDVGGYRVRHKSILEKMAKKIANRVVESKKEEELQAMSAFDRRIIHMTLKDSGDVETYSTGEGSMRRVVVAPKGMAQEDQK